MNSQETISPCMKKACENGLFFPLSAGSSFNWSFCLDQKQKLTIGKNGTIDSRMMFTNPTWKPIMKCV